MSTAQVTASEAGATASPGEMTKVVTEVGIALRSASNVAEGILHHLGVPTPAAAATADAPKAERTLRALVDDVATQAPIVLEKLQAIRGQL